MLACVCSQIGLQEAIMVAITVSIVIGDGQKDTN